MGSRGPTVRGFRSRPAAGSRKDPDIRTPPGPGPRVERFLRAAPSRGGDVDRGHLVADLDLVHHIHPGADLAEMVVDPAGLEEWRCPCGDEELRAAHAGGA